MEILNQGTSKRVSISSERLPNVVVTVARRVFARLKVDRRYLRSLTIWLQHEALAGLYFQARRKWSLTI